MMRWMVVLAWLLALGAPPAASAADGCPAAKVLHGGVVHTVDASRPAAEALAIGADGRIVATGDSGDLLERYACAEARDLGGLTVVPGFIDAHGHLEGLALSMAQADLVDTGSVEDIIARLEEHAATLGEGDWLVGRGWDQNDWPEQRFPTREALDAAFPDRPVWLRRIDGHAAWANGAAMAAADRDFSGDWQPEGGFIHRDANGAATGVFIDTAMAFIEEARPPVSEAFIDAALDRALAHLAAVGITGVHDAGVSRQAAERYLRRIEAGRFDLRLYAMADGLREAFEWACEAPVVHPSGRFTMRSVKLYADGALGSRGAALLEDYADEAGNRGLLMVAPEAMTAAIGRVGACGLQAAVHAIGDRANRVVLDGIEAMQRAHPDNPGRHRVEHVQVLDEADVGRFARLGIVASMQPTHATSDMYWAGDRLGPERERYAYAWRSLLDAGARLAFGSDFPVERANPMLGLLAAVARQDTEGWPEGGWHPEQAVSRAEALHGFTLGAAWAAFMEDEVGSLAPGKRADFVVLDADPMRVPVQRIDDIGVVETWLDGRAIFVRP